MSRPRTGAGLPTEDPGEGRRGFRDQRDSWRPLTGLLSLPDSGPQSPLSPRPARGCVLPLGGVVSAGHPFWASHVVGALVPRSCFQSQRMQNVSPVGRQTRKDRCTLCGPCTRASCGTRELPRGGNGQHSPILKMSVRGGQGGTSEQLPTPPQNKAGIWHRWTSPPHVGRQAVRLRGIAGRWGQDSEGPQSWAAPDPPRRLLPVEGAGSTAEAPVAQGCRCMGPLSTFGGQAGGGSRWRWAPGTSQAKQSPGGTLSGGPYVQQRRLAGVLWAHEAECSIPS